MSTYNIADCRNDAFMRVVKIEKDKWIRFCELVERHKLTRGGHAPFQFSSSLDLTAVVQKLKQASEDKDAKPLRKFFYSGIKALQSVKDLAAGAAGLNPYAAAGWTAIAFVAGTATRHKDDQKFGWDRISVLAQIDERYQIYEDVVFDIAASQASNAMLKEAMTDLLTQIFRFQIACVNAESHRAKAKEIFGGGERHQIDAEVQKEKQKFEDLQALVARETATNVGRVRYEEVARTLNGLRDYMLTQNIALDQKATAILTILNDTERNAILNWISDIRYKRIHDKDTKTPVGTTVDWLLQDKSYLDWAQSSIDTILWLFGHMGSGKSCVAHAVIENLKGQCSSIRNQRLVVFYCDQTDEKGRAEMSTVDAILRCMLKQLVDSYTSGAIDSRIVTVYQEQQHKGDLLASQCEELIIQLASDFDLIFVIDGLDEASNVVRTSLMKHLKTIMTKASRVVRLYISSRDVPSIREGIRGFNEARVRTVDVASRNKESIGAMIEEKVNSAANDMHKHLYIRSIDGEDGQSQVEQVKHLLIHRAGGMFLWANVALGFLHDSDSFDEMEDRLAVLSENGLEQVYPLYSVVFEKSLQTARKAHNEQVFWTMIMFVLYGENMSYRNWDVEVHMEDDYGLVDNESFYKECKAGGPQLWIQEACCLVKHQHIRKGKYGTRTLSSFCPGLFYTEESLRNNEGSLYLAHSSVREYIVTTYPELFEPAQAHAWLAGFCMHIFANADLRQQCETYADSFTTNGFKRSNGVFVYAASFWYHHLLQYNRFKDVAITLDQTSKPAKGSIQSLFVFDDVLNRFLLESPSTLPFLSWGNMVSCKVPAKRMFESYPKSFDRSKVVLTEKPSTIFARSYLGLPVDFDAFHNAGLLDVKGQACDGRTFGLAVKLRSIPMIESLLAKSCVSDRPYVDDGLRYTLSFFHILVEQAKVGRESCPTSELITVFQTLVKSGFDVMEHGEHAISAPCYLLTLECEEEKLLSLLKAFLEAGLSPIHEEKYVRNYYSYWTDYAVRYPQYGYTYSLVSLIAKYQRNTNLQIERRTNPLLFSMASTGKDYDKLLAQAAQAGNFALVRTLLETGADLMWEDCRSVNGGLCALEKALLSYMGGPQWNQILIVGSFDTLDTEIDRYRETIVILVKALVQRSNDLGRRKQFLSHPIFLNIVVTCCDIEIVKLWIDYITPMNILLDHPAVQWKRKSECYDYSANCDECHHSECVHIARQRFYVYPFCEHQDHEYGIIALYIPVQWHELPVNVARDTIRNIDSALDECRKLPRSATPLSDVVSHPEGDTGMSDHRNEDISDGDSNHEVDDDENGSKKAEVHGSGGDYNNVDQGHDMNESNDNCVTVSEDPNTMPRNTDNQAKHIDKNNHSLNSHHISPKRSEDDLDSIGKASLPEGSVEEHSLDEDTDDEDEDEDRGEQQELDADNQELAFDSTGESQVYDPRKATRVKTLQFYRRQVQETFKYLTALAKDDPALKPCKYSGKRTGEWKFRKQLSQTAESQI